MVERRVCLKKSGRSKDNDHAWMAHASHSDGTCITLAWLRVVHEAHVQRNVAVHECTSAFPMAEFFLAQFQHSLILVSGLVFQFEILKLDFFIFY